MADVFISYSSKDKVIADELCTILEQRGIKCWIAPRDIIAGDSWATAISTAISTSKVFMVIYSANSAVSTQVPKEINLASSKGVYIIPYKTDDTPFHGEFEYYLGTNHWIQADAGKHRLEIDELAATINSVIGKNLVINNTTNITNNYAAPQPAQTAYAFPQPTQPTYSVPQPAQTADISSAPKKTGKVGIIAAIVAVAVAAVILALVLVPKGGEPTDTPTQSQAAGTITADETGTKAVSATAADNIVPHYAVTDISAYEVNDCEVYDDGEETFSMGGESYSVGYTMSSKNSGNVKFNIKGQYTTLHLLAGHIDGAEEYDCTLKISVDGKEKTYIIGCKDLPRAIDIDVTGAKQIIVAIENSVIYSSSVGIAEMYFGSAGEFAETTVDNAEPTDTEAKYAVTDISAYEVNDCEVYDDSEKTFSMGGESYSVGYTMSSKNSGNVKFNVKGQYTTLHLLAGHIDGAEEYDCTLKISVDGKEKSYTIGCKDLPRAIDVDITGAKQIIIDIENSIINSSSVGIADMYFCGAGEPSPTQSEPVSGAVYAVTDIAAYETNDCEVYDDGENTFSMGGESYSVGYLMSSKNSGNVRFNVNGQYTALHLLAGHIDGAEEYDCTLKVTVDGKEKSYNISGRELPKLIELDITGAEQITVSVVCSVIYTTKIGIADMYVK